MSRGKGDMMCQAQVVEGLVGRAKSALAGSLIHELRQLQLEERGDGLLLSGVVSSFYHKQVAQELVRSVSKTMRVINSIRVQ